MGLILWGVVGIAAGLLAGAGVLLLLACWWDEGEEEEQQPHTPFFTVVRYSPGTFASLNRALEELEAAEKRRNSVDGVARTLAVAVLEGGDMVVAKALVDRLLELWSEESNTQGESDEKGQ